MGRCATKPVSSSSSASGRAARRKGPVAGCHTSPVFRHRPVLILNALGALWLAFGVISVEFGWPGRWAKGFPLIGDWLGEGIAALWVVAANVLLGLVLFVRWEAHRG